MSAFFGKILLLTQEKGPDVELKAYGDEFYGRLETLQGYSAIYDEDLGLYTYADLREGEYISTGIPIDNKAPGHLQAHLRESDQVRERKSSARFSAPKVER